MLLRDDRATATCRSAGQDGLGSRGTEWAMGENRVASETERHRRVLSKGVPQSAVEVILSFYPNTNSEKLVW